MGWSPGYHGKESNGNRHTQSTFPSEGFFSFVFRYCVAFFEAFFFLLLALLPITVTISWMHGKEGEDLDTLPYHTSIPFPFSGFLF